MAGNGWPVEPGRYRLIAARACPWANCSVIVRRLLELGMTFGGESMRRGDQPIA